MKLNYSKRDVFRTAKNVSIIIVGTLILAFGTSLFMLPYDLVTGGVSGYAIVLSQIIPPEILSVELIITILTWTMFFLGLIVLGKSFAMKFIIGKAMALSCGKADPEILQELAKELL